MALDAKVLALAQAIGADIKALSAGGGGAGGSAFDYPTHPPSFSVSGIQGVYYAANGYNLAASGTLTATAGRVYLVPIWMNLDVVGLSFQVTTLQAGSSARVGLYDVDSAGRPASCIYDSGDISTASTGQKNATFDAAIQLNGMYWVAFHASAAIVIRPQTSAPSGQNWAGWPDTGPNSAGAAKYYYADQSYGALPDDPTITGEASGASIPGVALKSSLKVAI